jgi:hypothetical protein
VEQNSQEKVTDKFPVAMENNEKKHFFFSAAIASMHRVVELAPKQTNQLALKACVRAWCITL